MPKAERFFRVLLLAYPREFRCEYQREMLTVFRDCYREEKERGKVMGIYGLWARVSFVIISAVLATLATIIDSSLSSPSGPAAILIGYAVSFLFWLAIHWIWAQRQNGQRLAT